MYKEESDSQSDWNMGKDYFQTLNKIKNHHVAHFIEGNIVQAAKLLGTEIDWVSLDIGKDKLTEFRRDMDNIMTNMSKDKKSTERKIIILRRKLWDTENERDILRPKDRNDYTDITAIRS